MCEILPSTASKLPVEEMDSSGNIVKRVSVPSGVEVLLTELSLEVLKTQPKDIYLFAANYFEHLLYIRNKILRGNESTEINAPIEYLKNVRKRLDDEAKIVTIDSSREENVPIKALEIVERTLENNINQISSVANKLTTALGKLHFETAGQLTDSSNSDEITDKISNVNLSTPILNQNGSVNEEQTNAEMDENGEEDKNLSKNNDKIFEKSNSEVTEQSIEQNEDNLTTKSLNELQMPQECDDSEFKNSEDISATTNPKEEIEILSELNNDEISITKIKNEDEIDSYLHNNDTQEPTKDVIENNISLINQNMENIVDVEVISKDNNNDTNNACTNSNLENNDMMDLIPDKLNLQLSGLSSETDKSEINKKDTNTDINITEQLESNITNNENENEKNVENIDEKKVRDESEEKVQENSDDSNEATNIFTEETSLGEQNESLEKATIQKPNEEHEIIETESYEKRNLNTCYEETEIDNKNETKKLNEENSDNEIEKSDINSSDEHRKREENNQNTLNIENFKLEESMKNVESVEKETFEIATPDQETIETATLEVENASETKDDNQIEKLESNKLTKNEEVENFQETHETFAIETLDSNQDMNQKEQLETEDFYQNQEPQQTEEPEEKLNEGLESVENENLEIQKFDEDPSTPDPSKSNDNEIYDNIDNNKNEKPIETTELIDAKKLDIETLNENFELKIYNEDQETVKISNIENETSDKSQEKENTTNNEEETLHEYYIKSDVEEPNPANEEENHVNLVNSSNSLIETFPKNLNTVNESTTSLLDNQESDDTQKLAAVLIEKSIENQDCIESTIDTQDMSHNEKSTDNITDNFQDIVEDTENITTQTIKKELDQINNETAKVYENETSESTNINKNTDEVEDTTKRELANEFGNENDNVIETLADINTVENTVKLALENDIPSNAIEDVSNKQSNKKFNEGKSLIVINQNETENTNEIQDINENKNYDFNIGDSFQRRLEEGADSMIETFQKGLDEVDSLIPKSVDNEEMKSSKESITETDTKVEVIEKIIENETKVMKLDGFSDEIQINDQEIDNESTNSKTELEIYQNDVNIIDDLHNTSLDKEQSDNIKELVSESTELDTNENENNVVETGIECQNEVEDENEKIDDYNDNAIHGTFENVEDTTIDMIQEELNTVNDLITSSLVKENEDSIQKVSLLANKEFEEVHDLIQNEQNTIENQISECVSNIDSKVDETLEKTTETVINTFQKELDSVDDTLTRLLTNDEPYDTKPIIKHAENQDLIENEKINESQNVKDDNSKSTDEQISTNIFKRTLENVADNMIDTFQKGLNVVDSIVSRPLSDENVKKMEDFPSNLIDESDENQELIKNETKEIVRQYTIEDDKSNVNIGDKIYEALEKTSDSITDAFQKGLDAVEDAFSRPADKKEDTSLNQATIDLLEHESETIKGSQDSTETKTTLNNIDGKIHETLEKAADAMIDTFQKELDAVDGVVTSSVGDKGDMSVKQSTIDLLENESKEIEKTTTSQFSVEPQTTLDNIDNKIHGALEKVADTMIDAFQKGLDTVGSLVTSSSNNEEPENPEQSGIMTKVDECQELIENEKIEPSESNEKRNSNEIISDHKHTKLDTVADPMIKTFQKSIDQIDDLFQRPSNKDTVDNASLVSDSVKKSEDTQQFIENEKNYIDNATKIHNTTDNEKSDTNTGDFQKVLEETADTMIKTFQKSIDAVDSMFSRSLDDKETNSAKSLELDSDKSPYQNENKTRNENTDSGTMEKSENLTENNSSEDNIGDKFHKTLDNTANAMIDVFQKGLDAVDNLVTDLSDFKESDNIEESESNIDQKSGDIENTSLNENIDSNIVDKIHDKLEMAADAMIKPFQKDLVTTDNLITNLLDSEKNNDEQMVSDPIEKTDETKNLIENVQSETDIVVESSHSVEIKKSDNDISNKIHKALEKASDNMIDTFQKGLDMVEQAISNSSDSETCVNTTELVSNSIEQSHESIESIENEEKKIDAPSESQTSTENKNVESDDIGDKILLGLGKVADTMIDTFQKGLDAVDKVTSSLAIEETGTAKESELLAMEKPNETLKIIEDDQRENEGLAKNSDTILKNNNSAADFSAINTQTEIADAINEEFQKNLITVDNLITSETNIENKEEPESAEQLISSVNEKTDENQEVFITYNSEDNITDKIPTEIEKEADFLNDSLQKNLDTVEDFITMPLDSEETDKRLISETNEEFEKIQEITDRKKSEPDITDSIHANLEKGADAMIVLFQKGLNAVDNLVKDSSIDQKTDLANQSGPKQQFENRLETTKNETTDEIEEPEILIVEIANENGNEEINEKFAKYEEDHMDTIKTENKGSKVFEDAQLIESSNIKGDVPKELDPNEHNFEESIKNQSPHNRMKRSENFDVPEEPSVSDHNDNLGQTGTTEIINDTQPNTINKISLIDTYKINKLFQYADIIDEKDIKDVVSELISNEKISENNDLSKCPLVVLNGKMATALFLIIERAKEENSRLMFNTNNIEIHNSNINYFSSPFTSVETVIDRKLKQLSVTNHNEDENLQDRGSRNSIPLSSEADSNDLSLSESQFNIQSHESGFSSRFSTSQESIIEQKGSDFEIERLSVSELDCIVETEPVIDTENEENLLLSYDQKRGETETVEGYEKLKDIENKSIIENTKQLTSKKLFKSITNLELQSATKPSIKKSKSDASLQLFEGVQIQPDFFDISHTLISESIETESEPDIFKANLEEEIVLDESIKSDIANEEQENSEKKILIKSKTLSNLNDEKDRTLKKIKSEGLIIPIQKIDFIINNQEKNDDLVGKIDIKVKKQEFLDEGFGEDENEKEKDKEKEKENKKDIILVTSEDNENEGTTLNIEKNKDDQSLNQKDGLKNPKRRERRKSPSNLYETSFLNRTIDYVEEMENKSQQKSGFLTRDVETSRLNEFQRPELSKISDVLSINSKKPVELTNNNLLELEKIKSILRLFIENEKVFSEKEQNEMKNLELIEGQHFIYDQKIKEQCNETNNVNYDKENLLKRGQEQAENKCINMHVAIYNKTHSNPNNFENNQITDANHVHLNEVDYFQPTSYGMLNDVDAICQYEKNTLQNDTKEISTLHIDDDKIDQTANISEKNELKINSFNHEENIKLNDENESKNENDTYINHGELLAKIDFDSNVDPEFEPEILAKIKLNNNKFSENCSYFQLINDKAFNESSLNFSETQSLLSHNIQKMNKAVILIQSVWRGFLVRRHQNVQKGAVHDTDQCGAAGFDLDDESNTDWRLPIKLREKLIQNEDRASSAPAAVVHGTDDDAGDVHIHVHVNSISNIQNRGGDDGEVVFRSRVPNGVFVTEKDRHQHEAEAAIAGAAAVAAAVVIQRQYRQYRTLKITTTITSSTICLHETTKPQLRHQLQQLNKSLELNNKNLQSPGDWNIQADTRNRCGVLKKSSTQPSNSTKNSYIFIDDISVSSETNEKGMKFIPVRNLIMMSNQQQFFDDENVSQSSVHSAATKIQAGFRGYQVRKQMKQNKESLTSSGGINNGNSSKSTGRKNSNSGRRKTSSAVASPSLNSKTINKNNTTEDLDILEKSATKIQAGVRGFLVRKRKQKKQ